MARNAASIRASMGVLVLTGCDRDASANSLYEKLPHGCRSRQEVRCLPDITPVDRNSIDGSLSAASMSSASLCSFLVSRRIRLMSVRPLAARAENAADSV